MTQRTYTKENVDTLIRSLEYIESFTESLFDSVQRTYTDFQKDSRYSKQFDEYCSAMAHTRSRSRLLDFFRRSILIDWGQGITESTEDTIHVEGYDRDGDELHFDIPTSFLYLDEEDRFKFISKEMKEDLTFTLQEKTRRIQAERVLKISRLEKELAAERAAL